MKQQNEDWYMDRAGCATASKFKDVMAVGKTGKPLKARGDYLINVLTERLTGEPLMSFTNAAMQWGNDNEEFARTAYEIKTGNAVLESKFVSHADIKHVGCSPDGLVDDDGGAEFKCPANSANHVQTIINNTMPIEHTDQVQGCMWVTGRKWWDFVSFDPRMPKHLQLFVQRIYRDEKYIADMEKGVKSFLGEVLVLLKQLQMAGNDPVIEQAAPTKVNSKISNAKNANPDQF